MKKLIEFPITDNPERVYCRSCGAGIYWVTTAKGKLMPLSARTERVGNDGIRVAQSHFADCPDAQRHRNKRSQTT